MTELKTLKDFKDWWNKNVGSIKSADFDTFFEELRQVAIGWIKHYSRTNQIVGILPNSLAVPDWKMNIEEVRSNLAKSEILKRFFNITEEDLK